MEFLTFIVALAVFFVAITLLVLAVLMPVYVMQINGTLKKLLTEQQRANELQRHLLRAYGHEPQD
jgi:heme exporter protein D